MFWYKIASYYLKLVKLRYCRFHMGDREYRYIISDYGIVNINELNLMIEIELLLFSLGKSLACSIHII